LLAAGPSLSGAEIFGIEKGVATSVDARMGAIKQAEGGVLFLDELGLTPIEVQAQLLEVMENKTSKPIGSTGPEVEVDVRFIGGASFENKILPELRYRFDYVLRLAPLREAREQIREFAEAYLREEQKKRSAASRSFTPRAIRYMVYDCDWPGNLRQLHAVVKRLVWSAASARIDEDDIRRALEFDPSSPGGEDTETRLRRLFYESAGSMAALSRARVEKIPLEEYYRRTGSYAEAAKLAECGPDTVSNIIRERPRVREK
jgi:transcriptional regulator with AAA-type ATPase domain